MYGYMCMVHYWYSIANLLAVTYMYVDTSLSLSLASRKENSQPAEVGLECSHSSRVH